MAVVRTYKYILRSRGPFDRCNEGPDPEKGSFGSSKKGCGGRGAHFPDLEQSTREEGPPEPLSRSTVFYLLRYSCFPVPTDVVGPRVSQAVIEGDGFKAFFFAKGAQLQLISFIHFGTPNPHHFSSLPCQIC